MAYQLREGNDPLRNLLCSGKAASPGHQPNRYTLGGLDWGIAASNYTLNFIPADGFDGGLYVGAPPEQRTRS